MTWLTRTAASWRALRTGAGPSRRPVHEAAGSGRRAAAWRPGNPGALATTFATGHDLRVKSRDLVRRNAWAGSAVDAFVTNCIGAGIKPQSIATDAAFREAVHALWWDWCGEADADGVTDFYGLQALACRAMLEGGECFVRLRVRRPEDGLAVPLQLQLLEAEHVPLTFNTTLPGGNLVRAGIEFDRLGRRIAYHLTRAHPGDPVMRPRDHDLARVPADRIAHLFRPLRPGQIRGEPWLAWALAKLDELDQFDDAALVKAKVAALFTGFVVSPDPEDAVMGGDEPDEDGVVEASLEPGTMQRLSPGQDVRFACRRRLDDPHRRTEGQGVLALARQRRRPAGRLQQPQPIAVGCGEPRYAAGAWAFRARYRGRLQGRERAAVALQDGGLGDRRAAMGGLP